ncbi:hypothetical protein [Bacillus sp. ISL-77]|uniref:hypothetical protein n=1 Tax=Bacillus sp. ISL-77 TaxID=2819138 RepID=UPI001BECD311|nr:hypothetical protein [Bacillus sp. ISL-77]MBT2744185.1 hypothetical protein [Bacillus sp. ISL-77]
MRKSKVYIYSTDAKALIILEAPHPNAGKEAYNLIKERIPTASIGIMGAKDIQTLRRTHRELKPTHVTKDVDKFLKAVSTLKNKVYAS